MKINAVTDYSLDGNIAVITLDSPPVNALSAHVRAGIYTAFENAIADDKVKAIVLMCKGRTFFAGADITEFGKGPIKPTLLDVIKFVENTPKPVIAALHGTALGGGLELALVAHFRVAVASAKCGLPEVKLGLLPGAGGTQRLPRVVGVQKALEMVTSGDTISSKDALDVGLYDAVIEEGNLRQGAIDFANEVVLKNRPLKKIRDQDENIQNTKENMEIFETFRKAKARKFRGFLAPEYNIRCIEASVLLPFEEGIKHERSLFEKLMADPQSGAQRHVFFAQRQVAKIADIPKDTQVREIEHVGVIGAGTMGGGIAMNFLSAGIRVTLVEMKTEALERGMGIMRKNYENTAKKGRMSSEDVEACMGRLTGSLEMGDLADCDLIIEAVFEQMDIKKTIFKNLDKIAKPTAILASNTSYLDLDEIASVTARPEDVVGLHFFSPANIMRLLEIVRGKKTSVSVLATVLKMAKRIGKTGVVVGNCFGFVGNRMLAQRQREADKLILEGAWPWDVDRVLYDFGLPMGPFAMRDMAGMDVGWDPENTSSSTVREILNEMGRRGQKTSAGFYDYDDKRKATPSNIVENVILDFCKKHGHERRTISDEEILQRCLYPMINEAANILAEGKAARASDIDIVWITGYGWPAYTGGPMYWADQLGLDKILECMQKFHAKYGDDFTPSPLLERLVAEGKSFQDI